jgi:hypothetical protein
MFHPQFIKVSAIVKYVCKKYMKLECHNKSPYAYLNRLFICYDNKKAEMEFHYDINKNTWKVLLENTFILKDLSTYELLYHMASNPKEDFSFGVISDFSAFKSDIFRIVSLEFLFILGKYKFKIDPYKKSYHVISNNNNSYHVIFDNGAWIFIGDYSISIDHWNLSKKFYHSYDKIHN